MTDTTLKALRNVVADDKKASYLAIHVIFLEAAEKFTIEARADLEARVRATILQWQIELQDGGVTIAGDLFTCQHSWEYVQPTGDDHE